MGARDLLAELFSAGLTLSADEGRLVVRPASKLSEEMRAALRASKADLLALLTTDQRPYKLTRAEGDAAHADPWDDGAIARFQARAALIGQRGFCEQDAEDLAERLHLRDVHADHRHMCLECRRYTPGQCGDRREAGLESSDLSVELVVAMQHCQGFRELPEI